MTEQELTEFLAALKKVSAEYSSSPEKARELLRLEGILTESGEIAEPYVGAFKFSGT